MISLDQIALWYLLVFGLYIGTDAVVRKGVMNRKGVFNIIAGVASLIVLAYYIYNMYSTEGMRPSMPQRSRTIPSADLVDIHHGHVNSALELQPSHGASAYPDQGTDQDQ